MSPSLPLRVRVFSAAVLFGLAPLSQSIAEAISVDLGSGVSLELIEIPSGKFVQGSPETEAGRRPEETQREVTLTTGFLLGKTPVTRGQFARFVAETNFRTEAETGTSGGFGWTGQAPLVQRKEFSWKNPGFAQTDEDPVTTVTYNDAKAFLAWLSRKSGRECRLPSEAQWEYAYRAGGEKAFGDDDSKAALESVGWFLGNAGRGTHATGSKAANRFGLYDMAGNVWEWCEDWYAPYAAGPQTNPLQTNSGLSDKPRRVLRGGSWLRDWADCRAAARYRNDPQSRNADNGFRVLASLQTTAPIAAPKPAAPPPATASTAQTESAHASPSEATPLIDHEPSHAFPTEGEPTGPSSKSIGFFATLGIGGIALFSVLRSMFRRHSYSAGEPRAAGSGRPVYTRIVDDGFWIEGDAIPRGAALLCKYTAGSESREDEIAFEPGPEGHFIFTGQRPTHVSVVYLDERRGYSAPMMRNSGSSISRSSAPSTRRTSTTSRTHPPAY